MDTLQVKEFQIMNGEHLKVLSNEELQNDSKSINKDKPARKKPVSRSLCQKGTNLLFSTPKRRIPMLQMPYVPPHRRNQNSYDIVPFSPRKLKNSTPIESSLTTDISVIENDVNIEKVTDKDIQRILEVANSHINEGFKRIANEIYIGRYGERLPAEWLKTIKFCVTLDNNLRDTKNLILNNKEVPERNQSPLIQNRFSTSNTEPGILKLENLNKEFWINIYSCKNVTEIWGVIIDVDHLGKVEELANEMKLFYEFEKPTKAAVEGSFYAALDGSWHRVKCLKNNGSTAIVSFIDRGDEDTFPVKKLHMLDQKFCSLPAQAIKMSLSDLDIFLDCDDVHVILDELLFEKAVFAEVNNFNQGKNDYLSVHLYLKKVEETISINDLIIHQMCNVILDPKLHIQNNKTTPVRISHVSERGIFIQFNTKSLKYFEILMKKSNEKCLSIENLKRLMVVRFEENKIYFVKNNKDNKWYRAKIFKFKDDNEILVTLIDIGSTIDVKREDIISLEKLCSISAKYPQQAIEVQLDQLSTLQNSRTLNRLHNLTSGTENYYVTFITSTSDNNNVPIVQLFKKTQSNFLASINDALLLDQEIATNVVKDVPAVIKNVKDIPPVIKPLNQVMGNKFDLINDTFMLEVKARLKEIEEQNLKFETKKNYQTLSISSLLSPPDVPKGSYFDVHIIIANDPSHFVVQLLRSRTLELTKMICEMSKVCSSYKGPKLTHESIKIGQLYASKYDLYDHQWYRVYVTKIIDKKLATVYYCDYGNYRDISIETLIPLQNQFYKLPYQAIWAELLGVKPVSVSGEWSVRDCLRFKDLTQSKNFVCIAKSKRDVRCKYNNKFMPTTVEVIYGLELIDTSTNEDVYVADILINEGRALKKTEN